MFGFVADAECYTLL